MAGRYGRLCNKNRDKYIEDVNFLYWQTSLCLTQVAKNLGISASAVDTLLRPKPEGVETPPTMKRMR